MRTTITTAAPGTSMTDFAVTAIWVPTHDESPRARFDNLDRDAAAVDPTDVAKVVARYSDSHPLVVERSLVVEVHPPGKWPTIVLTSD